MAAVAESSATVSFGPLRGLSPQFIERWGSFHPMPLAWWCRGRGTHSAVSRRAPRATG